MGIWLGLTPTFRRDDRLRGTQVPSRGRRSR